MEIVSCQQIVTLQLEREMPYLELPDDKNERRCHSDAEQGEADDEGNVGAVIFTDELIGTQSVHGPPGHRLGPGTPAGYMSEVRTQGSHTARSNIA